MLLQLTLTKDEHPIPATGCCIYRSGGSRWRLQPKLHWRLPLRQGDRTAFGLYRREAGTDVSQLFGLLVLSVEGEQIASLVASLDLSSLSSFAFPARLAGSPT